MTYDLYSQGMFVSSLLLAMCISLGSLSRENPVGEEVEDLACVELEKMAKEMNLLSPGRSVQSGAICNLAWNAEKVNSLKERHAEDVLDFNSHLNLDLTGPSLTGQMLILSREQKNVLSISAQLNDRQYNLLGGVLRLCSLQSHLNHVYYSFTAKETEFTLIIEGVEWYQHYALGRVPCFSPSSMERKNYVLPSRIWNRSVDFEIEYLYGIYQDVGQLKPPAYDIRLLEHLRFVVWKELEGLIPTEIIAPQLYERGICLIRLIQLLKEAGRGHSFENLELKDISIELETLKHMDKNDDVRMKDKTQTILLKACRFLYNNSNDHKFTLGSLLRILKEHEPTLKDSIILEMQYLDGVDFQIKPRDDVDSWRGIKIYHCPEVKNWNYYRYAVRPFDEGYAGVTLLGAISSNGHLFTFSRALDPSGNEETIDMTLYHHEQEIRTINSSWPQLIRKTGITGQRGIFRVSTVDAVYIYHYVVELDHH